MEAPDKIYIRTGMSGLLYGSKEKSFESDIEYIRKDLLLEWANKAHSDARNGTINDTIRSLVFEEIVNKLNSL